MVLANWMYICRRRKSDSNLSPYKKINSRWKKDLHLRPEVMKLLKENLGETLQNIGVEDDFLGKFPKAKATRAKLNK